MKDFLDGLKKERPRAAVRLFLDLKIFGAEGLQSGQISIRSLGGGLWELRRRYEGVQYRIAFCLHGGAAWLLHVFEKRSAKTPHDDLQVAQKRMKEVKSR